LQIERARAAIRQNCDQILPRNIMQYNALCSLARIGMELASQSARTLGVTWSTQRLED